MQKRKKSKVVALVNQKGGVAKTTTTWNLGVELAVRGNKVCLIDMDPQASLTLMAGVDINENTPTVAEWFGAKSDPLDFEDVVMRDVQRSIELPVGAEKISTGKLDLIPTDIRLSAAEAILQGKQVGREQILNKRLLKMNEDYDYIIIDAPPSLTLLTINILIAADQLIIPTRPELVSADGLRKLFGTMGEIAENFNKEFDVGGILLTMAKSRTTSYRQVKEAIQELSSELDISVYETFIRDSVIASDFAGSGLSVIQYKKNSSVAEDYRKWVDEYLESEGKK